MCSMYAWQTGECQERDESMYTECQKPRHEHHKKHCRKQREKQCQKHGQVWLHRHINSITYACFLHCPYLSA